MPSDYDNPEEATFFEEVHARQLALQKLENRHKQKPLSGRRLPTVGYRGIAIESLDNPNVSSLNVGKWSELSKPEMRSFLDGYMLRVHSSNVFGAWYDKDSAELIVIFRNGSVYAYAVPVNVAMEFLRAVSKGVFIWDALRVRGSKNGHKYSYRKMANYRGAH